MAFNFLSVVFVFLINFNCAEPPTPPFLALFCKFEDACILLILPSIAAERSGYCPIGWNLFRGPGTGFDTRGPDGSPGTRHKVHIETHLK